MCHPTFEGYGEMMTSRHDLQKWDAATQKGGMVTLRNTLQKRDADTLFTASNSGMLTPNFWRIL